MNKSYILGISCFYHDSAACLLLNGDIIAAAQEERFTRKKHDSSFPVNSIQWCLTQANINIKAISIVIFYDEFDVRFGKMLLKCFGYKGKIIFSSQSRSYAASAFYPSPFNKAAILVLGGPENRESVSFGTGNGNRIELTYWMKYPHSLGRLYSAFTYYCGFKINSGEYKLMGLAPYGKPRYKKLILDKLLDLNFDGSFKLNMRYFNFNNKQKLINSRFEALFRSQARKPESQLKQHYMDVAASIQAVTADIMLMISKHVYKVTGMKKLCLAGEMALNCVGNSNILKNGPFDDIWGQPASSDAGGAIGAGLLAWYSYLNNRRSSNEVNDKQHSSLLGPQYSNTQIEKTLKQQKLVYRKLSDALLVNETAGLIAKGKIIGWFQGRLEFGPRALGSRSILADSRDPDMQQKINYKVKFREPFRPFAPSVLAEKAREWFNLKKSSPYMLFTFTVKSDKKRIIPAVTHIDNSARVQTVDKRSNPLFYETIRAFYRKTRCPVVINTSFNIRGEPLVCSPLDALKRFMNTEIDHLVIGNFILDKTSQKNLKIK